MGPVARTGSGTLPVQFTRFFGRGEDVARLEELVSESPVLTLAGGPGCGKTRLSVELASRLASRFPDGVWFVPLPAISDPPIASEVAEKLGIDDDPGRPIEETLVDALTTAELLVVLDNCEHVARGVSGLAHALVSSCPAVRVLVTSRVALGLAGERVWRIPPLTIGPAVELFLDRAKLVSADFQGGRTAQRIEEICHRLDGLPLAIELVAAWTRVLSPCQILDRLDTALPLLRTHGRHTNPHQETMEATVGWSLQRLPEPAQCLFDRLSVFAGGFDLAAAEAIAKPAVESDDVLAELTTLVDHSLVLAEQPEQPTCDSQTPMRYRLLEPVRQCGEANLAAQGKTEVVRRTHAEHYVVVAQQCHAELSTAGRIAALRRHRDEEGNFQVALQWAHRQGSDLALRLCTALAHFWELSGRINEGRDSFERALQVNTADRHLRATALARAGRIAWRQQDYARSREFFEQSLKIEQQLGDQSRIARRSLGLAWVTLSEGDSDRAVQLYGEVIHALREQADQRGLPWALIHLGWAHYLGGDTTAGIEAMQEALSVSRDVGHVAATAASLAGLSHGAQARGDLSAAHAHFVAALDALREAGGLAGEPWPWAAAVLAANEGRFEAALRLAGAATAISRGGGSHVNDQFYLPLGIPLDEARRAVGAQAADRLSAEGASMTLEQLVTEAIAEPTEPARHPCPAGNTLTPREREVANLVGHGLSNGEIAEKLFISKRTVETHVEHIKQKLGHTRRHEIMASVLRESVGAAATIRIRKP